jgi:hypothetical protein
MVQWNLPSSVERAGFLRESNWTPCNSTTSKLGWEDSNLQLRVPRNSKPQRPPKKDKHLADNSGAENAVIKRKREPETTPQPPTRAVTDSAGARACNESEAPVAAFNALLRRDS